MKAWGVYDDEIRELAHDVGLRILGEWDHIPRYAAQYERWRELYPDWDWSGIRRDGNGYRFRLGLRERLPTGELKFQKIGYGGRRTSGVCWHGYREFLVALFRKFPDARVQTALGDFRGRDSFWRLYPGTRDRRGFNFTMRTPCVCQPQPRPQPPIQGPYFQQTPYTFQIPDNWREAFLTVNQAASSLETTLSAINLSHWTATTVFSETDETTD